MVSMIYALTEMHYPSGMCTNPCHSWCKPVMVHEIDQK